MAFMRVLPGGGGTPTGYDEVISLGTFSNDISVNISSYVDDVSTVSVNDFILAPNMAIPQTIYGWQYFYVPTSRSYNASTGAFYAPLNTGGWANVSTAVYLIIHH